MHREMRGDLAVTDEGSLFVTELDPTLVTFGRVAVHSVSIHGVILSKEVYMV